MERKRVVLGVCNSSHVPVYLEAIDNFPEGVYLDEKMMFDFRINDGAAVFIPIFAPADGNFCDAFVADDVRNARSSGRGLGLCFNYGDFSYQARTTSEGCPNDKAGGLLKKIKKIV